MNKNFDLHRLGMLLRWDALAYGKKYVRNTLAVTFGFSFICLLYLYNMHYNDKEMLEMLTDAYLGNMSVIFMTVSFFVFIFNGASIFNNMQTKVSRTTFLMLPANNIEKYISRLIYVTVGSLVMLSLAWILADCIQFLFSLVLTPGLQGSFTCFALDQLFADNAFNGHLMMVNNHDVATNHLTGWLLFISYIIFSHSFFTLGGSFFRKYAVLCTMGVSFVLVFVIIIACGWVDMSILKNIMQGWHLHINLCIVAFSIFLLAWSVLDYWLAYKLFCRMQVINNKWLN